MPRDPVSLVGPMVARLEDLATAAKVGKPYAYCETGDQYVTFKVIGHSPGEALDALEFDLREYIRERKGTLYWRYEPKIMIERQGTQWGVFTRIVVTDRPISEFHATGPHHCPACGKPMDAPNA